MSKTAGMSENLLKIYQVRKDSQGPLSQFISALRRVSWYLVLYFDRNIPLPASILSFLIEDADVSIFHYITKNSHKRLQPGENNDRILQTVHAARQGLI